MNRGHLDGRCECNHEMDQRWTMMNLSGMLYCKRLRGLDQTSIEDRDCDRRRGRGCWNFGARDEPLGEQMVKSSQR